MAAGPDLARVVRLTGVRDVRVLEAMAMCPAQPRPDGGAEHTYRDEPIPIPGGQVTTQPSLVARMLERWRSTDTSVLEIGTGYGWQTVLLARLVADVVSVERLPAGAGGGAQPRASRLERRAGRR